MNFSNNKSGVAVSLSRVVSFILISFGCYLHFAGSYGSGGGFQSGVCFGASIIIYDVFCFLSDFKSKKSDMIATQMQEKILSCLILFGLFIYSFSIIFFYLSNVILPNLVIDLIEIGISISVASSISLMYFVLIKSIMRYS